MKSASDDVVLTEGFEARVDAVSGTTAPKAALTRGKKAWTLVVGDTAATLRVRIYRTFKKNDFTDDSKNDTAFDLKYGVATLENVRSYLDKDIWVPVRDFLVNVAALPAITCAPFDYDKSADATFPLEVGKGAIVVKPPVGAPRLPPTRETGRQRVAFRFH
ncbi:MAG: hypothetical protein QM736_22580 [Vicinamibacterales bacterium]